MTPFLLRLCLPISSASVSDISHFVVQFPRMDVILMWYWMADQVRTMISSVIYKSKLNMGEKYYQGPYYDI